MQKRKGRNFFVLLVFLVCRFCFCCLSFLLLCIPLLQWVADGDSEEDGWRAIEVGAGIEGSNNGSRISNFVLGLSSLFSWVLLVPIVISRGAFVVVLFIYTAHRAQNASKGRQARHAHTGQGTRNWQSRRVRSSMNLASRGGKRAQKKPQQPKILGSRTKRSHTPPVTTSEGN